MSPLFRSKLTVVFGFAAVTAAVAPSRALAQDAPAEKAVPSSPAVAVPPAAGVPAPAVPSGGPQDRGSAAPQQPPPPVAPSAVPAVAPAPWQGRYDEIELRTRALDKNAVGPLFQLD